MALHSLRMSSETARWDSLTGAEVWAIGASKHPAERSLDQRRLMLSPTYTASLSRGGERRRVEEDLAAAAVQNRQPEGEHAQGDELADRDVVPGLERHHASQAGETQIPEISGIWVSPAWLAWCRSRPGTTSRSASSSPCACSPSGWRFCTAGAARSSSTRRRSPLRLKLAV